MGNPACYVARKNSIAMEKERAVTTTLSGTAASRLSPTIRGSVPPDVAADDVSTAYSYNRDRQLTAVLRPGGAVGSNRYDKAGRIFQTLEIRNGSTRVLSR